MRITFTVHSQTGSICFQIRVRSAWVQICSRFFIFSNERFIFKELKCKHISLSFNQHCVGGCRVNTCTCMSSRAQTMAGQKHLIMKHCCESKNNEEKLKLCDIVFMEDIAVLCLGTAYIKTIPYTFTSFACYRQRWCIIQTCYRDMIKSGLHTVRKLWWNI